ncbi:hypothetical protein [Chloroflexus aggregans]|uniref:Uncharacterized protein n=1 Tax=Chloroflexus aggregans (strain MD-66 / DSM 9485) TaxID=326427 RepID=B8G3K8_CHLAD|nr:hypothetical protein [Chloroflexus aggregans]ACL23391.1 hypothetical protein Cagg_0447 [Chloroflexus aggregans DSM 9485]
MFGTIVGAILLFFILSSPICGYLDSIAIKFVSLKIPDSVCIGRDKYTIAVKVGEIMVLGDSRVGVHFEAPDSGYYLFKYEAGAYTFHKYSSTQPTWTTGVNIVYGKEITWKNGGPENVVKRFADKGYFLSDTDAEIEAEGEMFKYYLKKGEIITFIAVDGYDTYSDNEGYVKISCYFVSEEHTVIKDN